MDHGFLEYLRDLCIEYHMPMITVDEYTTMCNNIKNKFPNEKTLEVESQQIYQCVNNFFHDMWNQLDSNPSLNFSTRIDVEEIFSKKKYTEINILVAKELLCILMDRYDNTIFNRHVCISKCNVEYDDSDDDNWQIKLHAYINKYDVTKNIKLCRFVRHSCEY